MSKEHPAFLKMSKVRARWIMLVTWILLVPTAIIYLTCLLALTVYEWFSLLLMTLLFGGKLGRDRLKYSKLILIHSMTSGKRARAKAKAKSEVKDYGKLPAKPKGNRGAYNRRRGKRKGPRNG